MPHFTTRPRSFLLLILSLLPTYATVSLGQSAIAKSTAAPAGPEAAVLTFENPVEREISSGEKHVYRVNLSEGEFAMFTVEQLGIDMEEQLIDLEDVEPLFNVDGEDVRNRARVRCRARVDAIGGARHWMSRSLGQLVLC